MMNKLPLQSRPTGMLHARTALPAAGRRPLLTAVNSAAPADSSPSTASQRQSAEIEAAVHEAMEAELNSMQASVFEAVMKAQKQAQAFNIQSNANSLMFLNGVVLLEKGLWELWDLAYGDGVESNVASVFVGLTIIGITRYFNLPLAEWKPRPTEAESKK